jgi:hypothetical protein
MISLGNAVFFDLEIFRLESGLPVWAAGFRWWKDGELKTRMIDSRDLNSRFELRKFIKGIEPGDRYLTGYNVEVYDLPIVAEILSGRPTDIKDFSDNLIGSMNTAKGPERAELLRKRFDSWSGEISGDRVVDLIYRSSQVEDPVSGSKSEDELRPIGLKHLLTQLGEPEVRPMPLDHRTRLNPAQWDEIKAYCLEDLKGTETVFKFHAGTIASLGELSTKYGVWLVNKTDSQVGELVLRSEFRIRTGAEAPRVPAPDSFKVLRPKNLPTIKTDSVRDWSEFIFESRFPLEDGVLVRTKKAGGPDPDPKTLEVSRELSIGPYRFSMGFGGVHQIVNPGCYRPGGDLRLVSIDVRSFYPSIAVNLALPLGGMGSTGTEILRELMEERFRLKDKSQDPKVPDEERKAAKTASDSLKIVINSVFGRTGFKYSCIYSPGTLFSITILGQIYLLSLVERLVEVGVRPIDSNTDGVFCLVPDEIDLDSILNDWQLQTGFVLETEELDGFIVQAQNIRLTQKRGKWSGKGRNFASISGRNPGGRKIDPPIVSKAVIESLINRTPISRTVESSTDPKDFILTKKYKSSTEVKLRTEQGETRLDPLIRVYASRAGGEIVSSTDRADNDLPGRVGVAYTIPERIPKDLDREFYVAQARKILENFPDGFRPEDLSGLALEVWSRGLVPAPAYGKRSLRGISNKGQAVSLEDWSRVPTIKAYSGPVPGGVEGARPVLIIDIDKPDRWKDHLGFYADEIRNSDCLTVYSGDSPDEVRGSKLKGKLIFEFESPEDHRFRRMRKTTNKALEGAGIELFYGQAPVSVLGQGGGKIYKLGGELRPLPLWLKEILLKLAGKNPPPTNRPGKGPREESFDHSQDPVFEDVFKELGLRFDSKLSEVQFRLKRKNENRDGVLDNRLYAVFTCPEGHERSDPSEAMLILDWEDGLPAYSCKHATCQFSDRFRAWVREERRRARSFDPETFREDLGPIGQAMSDPEKGVLVVHAGTGAGKTHAAIDQAYLSLSSGRNFLYLAPSRQLLMSFQNRLKERYPSVGNKVVNISMAGGKSDEDDKEQELPEEIVFDLSGNQVEEVPRVYLACHELSYRRGFSRFMSRLWTTIEALEYPFDVVIDESHQFFRGSSINIPLSRRYENRAAGNKVRSACLDDCPANRSLTMGGPGSCEACELVQISGAYSHSTKFGIPELVRPRFNDRDSTGEELVIHQGTRVRIEEQGIETGNPFLLGDPISTEVREIVGYKGRPINRETRRELWRLGYKGNRNSESEFYEGPETSEAIFEHILRHLFGATIKVSFPTDTNGNRITREEVIGIDKSIRSNNVIFPVRACEVPRVQGIDLAPLEMFRRMTSSGSRLIFMSASFNSLDRSIMEDVFGEDWFYHRAEGQPNRIESIQVVTVLNENQPYFIQSIHPAWLTLWKEFGPGILFAPSERIMNLAHESIVRRINLSERSIELNIQIAKGSGAHLSPVTTQTSHEGIDWTLATPRKPIGTGYDGVEVIATVLDLRSTRLAEDLITPHGSGPEDYRECQTEELFDHMAQSMGRVGRGPQNKRAVVLILNADSEAVERLLSAGGLRERTEEIGFSHYSSLCREIFEDGSRFLAGSAWEVTIPKPQKTKHHKKMDNVERESKKQGKAEEILTTAIKWKRDGKTLREFIRKNNIERFDRSTLPGIKSKVRELWNDINEDGATSV